MDGDEQIPYSPEIRAKYCEPDEDIDFNCQYCAICGCVLNFDEKEICDDCLFESSRELTGEEVKYLAEQCEQETKGGR